MIAQAQPPRNPPTPGEPPLRLRGRADLAVRRQVYQGCTSWVIKDPLSLRYFRLREEEYAVLAWLDGRRSLANIKRAYDARFSPRRIEAGDLWQYIVSLHQSGLVIADAPGQGEQLRKRRDERSRKERWSKLANLLAIRFRGIDPTRLLNLLYPAVRWMFSPVAVAGCLLLALSALLLVLVEFQVFQSRLPAFQQFFSLGNSLWLLAAMAFAKVLHEFGHGLTCRHYRGECHELGVMLLVFTPCLYCNVSDSWLLPNKWQRIAIAAAGMYVEVVLAAICTFLWWFSQEGLFNHLCLNLMLVCSVSTIVFNANPLLRFDGYYILADLVEIPNLRSKASRVLTRGLGRWCLGIESPHDPLLPTQRPGFFVFYSLAAVAYRWIITFSILYFLMNVFEPYGLQPLGHLLIACSLVGLVGVPLWRLGQYFQTPGRLEQVKRANLLTTLALLGGIAAVVAGVPFPHRVNCDFALEPHEAEPVYVQTAGQLQQVFVQPGQSVSAGQPLASLVNLDGRLGVFTPVADGDSGTDNTEAVIAALRKELTRLENENAALRRQLAEVEAARKRSPDDFASAVAHTLDTLQHKLAQTTNPVSRFAVREVAIDAQVTVDVSPLGTLEYRFVRPEDNIDPSKLSRIRLDLVPLPREDAGLSIGPEFSPYAGVEDIIGVGETWRGALNRQQIYTINDLLVAGSRLKSSAELAALVGVDRTRLAEWIGHAELLSVRAIDPRAADVLWAVGIRDLATLAGASAEEVAAKYNDEVARRAQKNLAPIDAAQARAWIEAAIKYNGRPREGT